MPEGGMPEHLLHLMDDYKQLEQGCAARKRTRRLDHPKPKSRKNVFDHLSPLSAAIRSDFDTIINTFRTKVRPLAPEVSALRTIKSEAEQKLLRSAGEVSGRAHASVRPL